MDFLPVSLNIKDKKILIVGGGNVALHKASILAWFTSSATVVFPEFLPGFGKLPFLCIEKEYSSEDIAGKFLVYICTGDRNLNSRVKTDCLNLGILASVCDDPRDCDFISPAIYKSGNLTIAVGSDSRDVKRSIRVRDRIGRAVKEHKLDIE